MEWRTSTYSREVGNCVEVAESPQLVKVRDTQHRHLGHLTLPVDEWRAFVHALKADEL